MGLIEEKIKQLENYLPELTKRPDFSAFWQEAVREYSAPALGGSRSLVSTPISDVVDTYDVTFLGHDQTLVHAWYLVPKYGGAGPGLVRFPGYTGGRGYPEDHLALVASGFTVLAIDARGQGGQTGNNAALETGSTKGWVSQGILKPKTSYYHALLGDAYRAVEWLRSQPEMAGQELGVIGSSQGGGLALWSAALHPVVSACVANIPNMCHLERGVFASTSSLQEVADFVHRFPEHYQTVMDSLSYFDFVNKAEDLAVPVMISVGLKDTVCLPETIYAAYNRIRSEKTIEVYPFTGHFVGNAQNRKAIYFLRGVFNRVS